MQTNAADTHIQVVHSQEQVPADVTQKLQATPQQAMPKEVERPLPSPAAPVVNKENTPKKIISAKVNKGDAASARVLEERCRQLCLFTFFREHAPVRSLGFTSSIAGEGKSFLALITARVLAHDSINPVTLVECNWEHPEFHERFDIPATPGLAEWLSGMCDEEDIRYEVERNLTVIPAGDGSRDAVKLLKQVQRQGFLKIFEHSNELFIVDLPPIISTGYGTLAAGLLESIIVVVRAQVTPDSLVVETCARLNDVPVHGIIINQRKSQIPQWIQQIL